MRGKTSFDRKAYRRIRSNQFYERINALKAMPCTDCHEHFAPECMDFDHLGVKRFKISQMSQCRWETVQAELRNTELVCANCHRIRTRRRTGSRVYNDTSLAHVIDHLKKEPCTVCRGVFPPECMDFDHKDPFTKTDSVAQFRNRHHNQLVRLLEVVAACDLVCSCCHRMKTKREWHRVRQK